MKKVRFSDDVQVFPVPKDEDRTGFWAIDGWRFRHRVKALEDILKPFLKLHIDSSNHATEEGGANPENPEVKASHS